MRIEVLDKKDCCGCHGCMNACPVDAIEMVEDLYGFKYPQIDESKCINCGLCKKVCPIINIKNIKNEPKAYACYNKNEEVRLNSSSGGIFTLLAENIINKGGIVYGAAFDNEFMVKHIRIDNVNKIDKLRTSKYLQSQIDNTYKRCKNDLDEGKIVLFTGTPCQIEGLISYLGKDFDNLYTQDIVCHGVPSPKVWQQYLKFRNKLYNDEVTSVNFRNKDNGWRNYNYKISYKNHTYKVNHSDDLYSRAFLANIDLRDSCYDCKFKKLNRLSDITLADFWGVQNVIPKMYDKKGTSLISINSEKGKKLLDSIIDNIIIKEVDFNVFEKYNPSFCKSSSLNKNRDNFMNEINDYNFDKVVNKYIKKETIKRILKRILKR